MTARPTLSPKVSRRAALTLLAATSTSGFAQAALQPMGSASAQGGSPSSKTYRFTRQSGPARTEALNSRGQVVATFTDGARTVTLTGPSRTLSESANTSATVSQSLWVRLAPRTWRKEDAGSSWVTSWLNSVAGSTSPDALATGSQYIQGAPALKTSNGIRYAGDAAYGPLIDGQRAEGSDVPDYLGTSIRFADGITEYPHSDRYGSVDCSGFVRLLLGYRLGFPLLSGYTAGPGLARRARDMWAYGPGPVVIPNKGTRPTNLAALRPGDLLFFSTEGDGIINHVGIYLGVDSQGRRRFLSSRKTVNGPTLGDNGGASVIDGSGLYATGFRAARRV